MSHRYKIDTNLLTICISIAIICTLFVWAPLLEIVNKNLYAGYLEMRNAYLNDAQLPEIVVVEIDDESLWELGAFPFVRSYYAESVKNLQSYSPAVIGFDILFLDPSLKKEDEQIYNMLENSDNIVFGSSINSQWEIGQNMFSADSGYLPVRVSALNNTVYSFVPQYTSSNGMTQEHFTLAILRKYYSYFYGSDDYMWMWSFEEEKYIFSPEHEFTLSKAGADDILINYDSDIRITSVPFSATLDKESLENYIDSDSLKDAIIIIGPAAEGFGDTFFTPYDRLFGVHIHAHILSTLISKSYLSYMDVFTEWCMIFHYNREFYHGFFIFVMYTAPSFMSLKYYTSSSSRDSSFSYFCLCWSKYRKIFDRKMTQEKTWCCSEWICLIKYCWWNTFRKRKSKSWWRDTRACMFLFWYWVIYYSFRKALSCCSSCVSQGIFSRNDTYHNRKKMTHR